MDLGAHQILRDDCARIKRSFAGFSTHTLTRTLRILVYARMYMLLHVCLYMLLLVPLYVCPNVTVHVYVYAH